MNWARGTNDPLRALFYGGTSVNVKDIRRLAPLLREYLAQSDDWFRRKEARADLLVYVRGQLSNLERKSVEPIALEAGMALRTLQEFLSQLRFLELWLDQHAAPPADSAEDSL